MSGSCGTMVSSFTFFLLWCRSTMGVESRSNMTNHGCRLLWSLELRNCYFLLNTIVDTFCYQRISFPEHTKTLSQNTFPTHSTALICGSFRHWHLSTSNINAHMLRLHESKYYRETTTSIRHMSSLLMRYPSTDPPSSPDSQGPKMRALD
jgi:hypothetical protein